MCVSACMIILVSSSIYIYRCTKSKVSPRHGGEDQREWSKRVFKQEQVINKQI